MSHAPASKPHRRKSLAVKVLASLLAAGGLHGFAAAAGDPPAHVQEFTEEFELFHHSSDPQHKQQLADSLESLARRAVDDGLERAGWMALHAANCWNELGEAKNALELAEIAADATESRLARVTVFNNAAHFAGRAFPADRSKQKPYHLELMLLVDELGPEAFLSVEHANRLFLNAARNYAQSVGWVEDAQQAQQMADTVDWIFTLDWIDTEADRYPAFLDAAWRVYNRTEQSEKAEQILALIEQNPPPGWEGPEGPSLLGRLSTALNGRSLPTDDPEVIGNLQQLWSDPETREHPLAMIIASTLISTLRAADARDAGVLVGIEAAQTYLSNRKAWEENARGLGVKHLDNADRVASEIMFRAVRNAHWREHAEELLPIADAFLERFDTHRFYEDVEQQRDRIKDHLATR